MKYEMIDFNTHMPVHCTMQRIGVVERHTHNYFELLLVLTGVCTVLVEGNPYSLRPEDILAINAHDHHELRGQNCALLCVQFEQTLFEKTLPEPRHPRFDCNSTLQRNNTAFDRLRRLLARLVKNNVDKQSGYELRNWAFVYSIMDELYNNFRVDAGEAQTVKAHRYAARVTEITAAINAHYAENLTLSRLAEQIYLSPPYLSKFFEQQFGMNFSAYLTRVRLNHAVEELLYTENTVEAVSEHSGFANAHAFVKAFRKEYGELPSIYRRNFRRKAPSALAALPEQHDYMALLKKYLDESPEKPYAAGESLVCSAECSSLAPGKALRHTWRELMTVGRAADLLYADVQDMVRRMQNEIGFRYIKLGDVFSDELRLCSRSADGELVFSFTYLDKVLDFVHSVGLRPFMQLSFMPAALARDKSRQLFNYLVSEPVSLDGWAQLVKAVTAHCLTRYGMQEVHAWRFCVWTQPETAQKMYAFSSDEPFYRFYCCTYRAVKDCDEALVFGSPSFYFYIAPNSKSWYVSFLRWCEENDCTPDFLNFTYYDLVFAATPQEAAGGMESFGFVGYMNLNQAPDGFETFVHRVLAETRRLGWNKPVYLTEMNSTPSQQDLLNDTCFKSCYIARCILEHYDRLDSFGYWSLTDWMGEAPLPQRLFFGGLGLFTANGVPKAVYYAMLMLRRLGDTLLGQGQGWFVTAGNGGYQVMLYNYRHYSYLYALGERFDMTFTDRYTPFAPERAMDAHLKLKDVPDGEYIVRETVLNRKDGSAFDTWVAIGALEPDTPEELDYLKSRSVPARRKYTAQAKNHALELDIWLDMLELRLLEIEKQSDGIG